MLTLDGISDERRFLAASIAAAIPMTLCILIAPFFLGSCGIYALFEMCYRSSSALMNILDVPVYACFLLGTPIVAALSFRAVYNFLCDFPSISYFRVARFAVKYATSVHAVFAVIPVVIAASMAQGNPGAIGFILSIQLGLWTFITLPLSFLCAWVFTVLGMRRLKKLKIS